MLPRSSTSTSSMRGKPSNEVSYRLKSNFKPAQLSATS